MAFTKKLVHGWILCFVFCLCFSFSISKMSDYIDLCRAKDPELADCLVKSGLQFSRRAVEGLPEYGIPPTNPIFVPQMEFNATQLGMHIFFRNSTVYGLHRMEFLGASPELDKFKLKFHNRIPREIILSKYSITGQFMGMDLSGKGKSNITVVDTDLTWEISGDLIMRDNKKYVVLKECQVKAVPRVVLFKFSNLFNGNRILGSALNRLINIHWAEIYQHLRPSFELLLGRIIFQVADKIFTDTPFNELFPDTP